jgi:hypothetical protein
MNSEKHNAPPATGGPVHHDVAFDPRDIRPSSVLAFLFYLAVSVVVTLLLCWGVWNYLTSRNRASESALAPVRENANMPYPPEPRLQGSAMHPTDAQQDLRNKLARDIAALEQTRWVDEKRGLAQIPIEDAIKIVAEKGLPAWTAKPVQEKKP